MSSVIIRYLTLLGLLCSVAWLASTPGWEPAIAVIGLLASFITMDRRFSPTPNLQGRWEYIVTTADKKFSHKGDCYIHQDGKSIRIHGVRRYNTYILKNRQTTFQSVEISWDSHWAQICDDNILRIDYYIATTEPKDKGQRIEAICRLKFNSKMPTEMIGTYYTLPPFEESMLNCLWGTISTRKIEKNSEISSPNIQEIEKQLGISIRA